MDRRCDKIRTALSARLDGEDPGPAATYIDKHLAACASCRTWREAAEQVTRAVRLRPADVPDLTVQILAAVAADQRATAGAGAARAARERRQILRVALCLSALLQLATAIPMLLGAQDAVHPTREVASFDIALAVGFLLAARWPDRARAFVPVAFVLAGCLTLTSGFDIAEGAAVLAHEVSHLASLAQAVLLWALSRYSTPPAVPQRREMAAS